MGMRRSPGPSGPSSSSLKSSSPSSSRVSLNPRAASIVLSSTCSLASDLALALALSLAWRWFLIALSVRPGRSLAMDAQRLPSFL